MKERLKGALLADRDGVIARLPLYSYGYDSAQAPEDVVLVNNIEKVIKWANEKGIPVIEISNQPGVAKGKQTQEQSDAIEARVHELLKEKGAHIEKAYICQHDLKGVVEELKVDCDCKKPKPGLLLMAAKDMDIDLSKSLFLGDKASDVEAGAAAGVRTILYIHPEDEPKKIDALEDARPDYRVESMEEVIPILEEVFKG